jgi:hypothetical protein
VIGCSGPGCMIGLSVIGSSFPSALSRATLSV